MVDNHIVNALKNIGLASIGAGVTIVAILKGITSYFDMTVLISYYAYYGIHVYNSNKIAKIDNPVKP